MLRYLSLILKNSQRNRRRSILTAASIGVSFCLLSILVAMYHALFLNPQANPAQALRLVTHHKVSITQPMPVFYETAIQQIPGVREAMVWQWYGGTYKDVRDPRNIFARFAIEPEKFFNVMSEIELPGDQKVSFQRLQTACIVGRKLAGRFGWKPGSRLTLVGDIFPVDLELTVVGIYKDTDDTETLYFNFQYLRELMKKTNQAARADEVGVFLVQAHSPDQVPTVAAAIDQEFENSPAPTKSESERAWQLSFVSFLGDLKLFLFSISGALTFMIILVSANTISMAVRERVREIGVLKVLGFRRRTILGLMLGESVFIAAVGGLSGIILATGVCVLVRNSVNPFAGLKLTMTLDVVLIVLLSAALVGLVSAFVPAWNASRTTILDSFSYVE